MVKRMRRFLYKVFSIFKILPIKNNKIVLINGHSNFFNGNILAIYDEITKRSSQYTVVFYKKNDFNLTGSKVKKLFKKCEILYNVFTAKYLIVNDYISLFSEIEVRKKTEFIQVWHAGGAFKKFGLNSLQNANNVDNIKRCLSCYSQYNKVIVSSKCVREIYASAFGIDVNKVIPLGLPRADKFYNEMKNQFTKNEFIIKYPKLKDKKILLYAPTFRDGERKNFKLKLDLEYMYNNLPDNYTLITKMHPFIKNGVDIPFEFSDRIFDLSFENIDDLMISSDILITDYSSMIFEYAILEKPMIFYAYDLLLYNNSLRGFYYDYNTFVPGPIVSRTEQIVEVIKKDTWDMEKIKAFKEKFNEYNDGKATQRIVDNILNHK